MARPTIPSTCPKCQAKVSFDDVVWKFMTPYCPHCGCAMLISKFRTTSAVLLLLFVTASPATAAGCQVLDNGLSRAASACAATIVDALLVRSAVDRSQSRVGSENGCFARPVGC